MEYINNMMTVSYYIDCEKNINIFLEKKNVKL